MESREAQESIPTPQKIVCVFAPSDHQWYQDLKTFLVLWERTNKILWLEMQAGHTRQTMQAYLRQANLILLLASPTFFDDHACYGAMLFAVQEQGQRQVPVVPILARACDWKESECSQMLALPDNELPSAEWEHQERAYENIRAGLARLIPGLSTQAVTLPGRPRLFQARDLPKGYVPRPKAFDEIKHQLLNRGGNQTTAITTALRGAGGFGKTTLALALCHDAEVQAAFPDGILSLPDTFYDTIKRVKIAKRVIDS